ncbi:nuclear transport factor 2 family protein [Tenacibaculum aiptasiae]|uniref:nuclear transport factor 2 family protein n=1 Tax=Tenacibaculum aiptasiae TaxID=426481 RepID=UPI003B5C8978
MRIFFSSFLILWTLNQAIAQNATKTHKDSLNTIIQKYYDLNLKVFQANSKIEDVNKIFELFSDDFTYIHPKYGGTYTREDLYNGYVRNQKNGGYRGEETAVKIVNKIIGLNAAVIQRSYVINKNGKLKDEEPKMTLFEFKKGKIFRIFEYW